MNPRRKQRLYAAISILMGIALTIGLALYAVGNKADYFFLPSEIHEGRSDGVKPEVGQRVRIGGMVVEGSVKRADGTLEVAFDLVDTGPAVTVKYDGILPDLFREGQGIVATGVLTAPTVIEAHEVLAKHDEEYMPPEVAEKLKGIKHVKPEYSKEGQ